MRTNLAVFIFHIVLTDSFFTDFLFALKYPNYLFLILYLDFLSIFMGIFRLYRFIAGRNLTKVILLPGLVTAPVFDKVTAGISQTT